MQIPEEILALARQVQTQDNSWHITTNPEYLVRRKERVYGMDSVYCDLFTWIHIDEGEEATQNTINLLEAAFHKTGKDVTPNYRRVGYAERDEHIEAFFSEANAREFMARNAHRYGPMHLYVDTAYRNHEWQAIRNFLLSIPTA